MEKNKRKIEIKMSVELDILVGDRPYSEEKEWLNMVAKNYIACLGDKNIKIEHIDFVQEG